MTSTLALLIVVAVIGLMAYAGQRDGAYQATYGLMRNFLSFMFALTFCRPLADLMGVIFGTGYPGPQYYVAISFALIMGVIYVVGRALKVKFTFPEVPCLTPVDRVGGAIVGVLSAVVITGALLILWSLLPFMKFIPGDLGRARVGVSALDTGAAMLTVYDYVEERMGGNTPFLLHDEPLATDLNENERFDPGDAYRDLNRNRRWDRGWLWRYRNHSLLTPADVERMPGIEGG